MREVGWVVFDEIHYMRDPGEEGREGGGRGERREGGEGEREGGREGGEEGRRGRREGGRKGEREGREGQRGRGKERRDVCFELLVHCVHVIEPQCCHQGNSFFPFVHEIMLVSHSSSRRAGCGLGGDHHSVARQRALCVSLRYHS